MTAAKGKGRMGARRLTVRAWQAESAPIRRKLSCRRWYAEDVALAMEMQQDGVPLWVIALHYGTTLQVLGNVLSTARAHGMSRYPSRAAIPVCVDRSSASCEIV